MESEENIFRFPWIHHGYMGLDLIFLLERKVQHWVSSGDHGVLGDEVAASVGDIA